MLLVLLSTINDGVKQKSIEGVFKNKIRSDLFTEELVSETMKTYVAVSIQKITFSFICQ